MRPIILTLTVTAQFLGACSALPPTPQTTVASPHVTGAPTRTLGPSGSPSPSPLAEPSLTATPDASVCREREGGLIQGEVNSELLVRPLPFTLYTPPCYDPAVQRGYPILILLHGLGGSPDQWVEMGVQEKSDTLIASGATNPFLIALPWHRTGIDIEIAVLDVLLPHVEAHYHALPGMTWRGIGGFSRGGGWALRIGLRNPGTFSAIGLHSPGVTGGDLTALELWLADSGGHRPPRIWIDIGEGDTLLQSTTALSERLAGLELDHQYIVRPGDHTSDYWSRHLEEYLVWYSERW